MNFEDNFDLSLHQSESSQRRDVGPLSLYNTNSRDSGFEEVPLEPLDDDAFLEEFAEINFSENANLPTDFSNLIQKPIATISTHQKPAFRRVSSLEESVSPLRKKVCQRSENEFLIRKKKLVNKSRTEEYKSANLKPFHSEEAVKLAIQRSCSEPDLVADFSRSYSLPLTASRHQDLKAIDSDTLRKLINGEFSSRVGSYKIIDCRYPYEYNGGHIKGAINIYTHDQCSALLEEPSVKPNILIFHCEFSAERGPNLYRHLRQEDRRKNVHTYPSLCYPEIYILEGGYRKFFEENSAMCSPETYTQMLDPKHSEDMIFFRHTSKTWNSDVRCTSKKNLRNKMIRKFVL